MTYEDLVVKLQQLDELTLLEILNIDSYDIIEKFGDRIESRWDDLEEDFANDPDDEDD